MSSAMCVFEEFGQGTYRCVNCGRVVRTDTLPINAPCRAAGGASAPLVQPREGLCAHLGQKLRDDACDMCGIKGQPFEVRACALHGECSLTRKHSKIRSCVACLDWTDTPVSADNTPIRTIPAPGEP